jgi:hypothetical protein
LCRWIWWTSKLWLVAFLINRRCYVVLIVGARNCTSREFLCVTSGECIPEAWVCDHEVKSSFFLFEIFDLFRFVKDDCEDGSDEHTDQCRKYYSWYSWEINFEVSRMNRNCTFFMSGKSNTMSWYNNSSMCEYFASLWWVVIGSFFIV